MLSVADIMTREPYTLGPDNSLTDARDLMAQHHVRHVPVVSSDGTIVGLVSHRDVLAASDSSVLGDGGPGKEGYVALSSIMTSPVKTIDERDSLRGTAIRLQKERIGCLPVTREGNLVGIISDSDFVAVAIHLMEQLELAEPEEDDF